MRLSVLFGLVVATLSGVALAQQDEERTREFSQSPAVLARYGDVPVKLDAPGLAPGRDTYTSQDEMMAFLCGAERARSEASTSAHSAHRSRAATSRYLVFTAEGVSEPQAITALDRPVVWLIGQQHGNEPAGGEAMLALSSALADGELTPLLDRVTVVIVPRANPGRRGGLPARRRERLRPQPRPPAADACRKRAACTPGWPSLRPTS